MGWKLVELDTTNRALIIKTPGVAFDFGAIAKGFILDQAADLLRSFGISQFMIRAGGEIVLGDAPPDEPGWFIGIDEGSGRIDTLLNIAIATSGDANQFVIVEGNRLSHLIDPAGGSPLTDQGVVTVTALTAAVADGAATAIRVGGDHFIEAILEEFPSVRMVKQPIR
jgi:thiamine biosynthesis lipoprotein